MKLLKIGRGQECDIVIEDIAVSREHAEIFQDDEGNVFLTDLKSSNGTFINGNQLHGSEVLKHNDIVKIGNTVIPWRNYLKGESQTTQIPKPAEKKDDKLISFSTEDISKDTKKRLLVIGVGIVAVAVIEFLGLQYDGKVDGFNLFLGTMLALFVTAVCVLVVVVVLRLLKITNPYIIMGIAGLGLWLAIFFGHQSAL